MSGLAVTLTGVVALLAVALGVRLLVRDRDRVSYASVLVAVGLGVSVVGPPLPVELTADTIFFLLLPVIIFQGTTTLDARELRHNAVLIAALTVVGLPAAVAALGLLATVAFGFELPVALLFAAVILPTDPAAVLSLFEEFDVAERLAVTIEGESLFNDGVAIVIFSSLLGAYRAPGESVTDLASSAGLAGAALDVAVVGGGGLVLGVAVGWLAHLLVRRLDDEMALLLTTIVVAYGSFLLSEHYLGLSGVLATVGAGLAMGAHEEAHDRLLGDPVPTHCQHIMVWGGLHTVVPVALVLALPADLPSRAMLETMVFGVAVSSIVVQGCHSTPANAGVRHV